MSNDDNKGNNTLGKVAAGAAIIGGVVAAVALSNKENRDNLKEGVNDAVDKAKDKGAAMVEDVKQKAGEVGTQAVARVVEEYNALKAKLVEYMNNTDNKDEVEQLQESADQIADSIQKAKAEGENVAQQLVDDIKKSLVDLSKNMEKLQAEKKAA